MVVSFNYEHIGLEFKSYNESKTFWVVNEDVQYYLRRYNMFKIATQLFFSSAIRNKFTLLKN